MWLWDLPPAAFDVSPPFPENAPAKYVPKLEAGRPGHGGCRGVGGAHGTFLDVGAIVYYLKAVPWDVPGFTVRTHLRHLLALQERLESGEELSFHTARFTSDIGAQASERTTCEARRVYMPEVMRTALSLEAWLREERQPFSVGHVFAFGKALAGVPGALVVAGPGSGSDAALVVD